MIDFEGINENFQFLVIEVKNQIYNTFDYLNSPEPEQCDKIVSRDDYIDNLKNTIENKCFFHSFTSSKLSKKEIDGLRAIHIISLNLERIADFCVNVVRQVYYLTQYKLLYSFNYEEMLPEIVSGITEIVPALKEENLSKALTICRTENNLDSMYKSHFDRILEEMPHGNAPTGDYITILFIVRYLERIGDSLLNIGEAILFVIIGERIKINQFQALQHTLNESGFTGSFDEVDLQLIWGTRSGCRIGRLENKEQGAPNAHNSVFKEGTLKKIKEEKKCLQSWHDIFPGIVPKVFSYYEEDEDRASLLLELLPGCTLDEIIVTADQDILNQTCEALEQILTSIWKKTLTRSPCPTNYINQLQDRFDSVQQIHPQLIRKHQYIGRIRSPSTQELLQRCQEFEKTIQAPFQVFIHGDFNINNIVYNHDQHHIHFVDLHRSKYSDFIQDISVFLVSNFRIPVFDIGIRKRLNWIALRFFEFSKDFAYEHRDKSFELRLALGLARSFYTSTRFELGDAFSREMYLRAHFLMDELSCYIQGSRKSFKFPKEILTYS